MCLLRGTDWVFIYNSTFCPHSVFMGFVWIWEQTAIIFLYSINWLVFITETGCVYCAVRTGSFNKPHWFSFLRIEAWKQAEGTHWTAGSEDGLHRRSRHCAEEKTPFSPPRYKPTSLGRTAGCHYVMTITVRAACTRSPHATLHPTRRKLCLLDTLYFYVQCSRST